MSVTETLADYVVKTQYEDLPDEAIKWAKLRVLDSLGCGIGGTKTSLGRVVTDAIDFPSKPESTIIGDKRRIACKDAAFVNSSLINALDFDDDTVAGHPSATIIPAALAVGERTGASGKEFLASIILSYEICTRIGVATSPSPERSERVWGIGTHQTFGAVAAAGKLLKLDLEEMLWAFGIAGAAAPLPSAMKWGWDERPLTWVKDSVALATISGVRAALLAQKGFIGCRSILDGETGFWVMAGSDRCDFKTMVKGLGQEYEIIRGGFKPYPCCKFIHSTLDAVGQIVSQNRVEADDIEEVHVRSIRWLKAFEDYEPLNTVDAEFSVPYTVAMIVLGEPLGPNWYEEEKLRDEKVLDNAKKVRIEIDPAAEKLFQKTFKQASTVEITIKDGKKFEVYVESSKGEPENPLTVRDLESKFRRLASFAFKDRQVEEIVASVRKLEKMRDVKELAKLLVP